MASTSKFCGVLETATKCEEQPLKSVNVSRLTELTPKARKLYYRSRRLHRIVAAYRRKTTSFKQRLKLAKHQYNAASSGLRDEALQFCLQQMNRKRCKPRGRRFTLEEKLMSLVLYKTSGTAYRFLSQWFNLPSRHTLRRFLQHINIVPGINANLMENLKNTVQQLKPKERLCMVMFDEVSLLPHLDFDRQSDQLVGIEDGELCDHALVFMVRGVTRKWKQVVSYTFCKGSTKAPVIRALLTSLVKELSNTGKLYGYKICFVE